MYPVGVNGEDVFILVLNNASYRNDVTVCGLFEQ